MKKMTVAFFTLIFLKGVSFALGKEDLIDKVQRKYREINDYKAKFLQTVEYVALDKSQTNRGIVYFKKTGKMRWEYSSPQSQIIVMNPQRIWFYMVDEKQVMVESTEKAFSSRIPMSLLSGASDLKKYFHVKSSEKFKEKSHGVLFQLIPKEPIKEIGEIYISVDEETFFITDTFIVDKFQNITHIFLTDISVNMNLPDELFNFEVPPGVQVVQPSEILKK